MTFAPLYTGSTWTNVYQAMMRMATTRARQLRGKLPTYSEAGPPLSNAEAVALIREWRDVSPVETPLWAHFAARAYGGRLLGSAQKAAGLMLRADDLQARAPYPVLADDNIDTVDLWQWVGGIAKAMDNRHDMPPPRISVDRDTFTDPVFRAHVVTDLQKDGIEAQFKIPLPACKDKKTGKLRVPRIPCDAKGRGPRDPATGAEFPCDKQGDCAPVLVDDPYTAIDSSLTTLAFWVALGWVLLSPRKQQSRRRRRS